MATNSYLTPNWLMSQVNQLLQTDRQGVKSGFGDALSKSAFMDKYYSGKVGSKKDRYYFSDWASDLEGYTGGMNSQGQASTPDVVYAGYGAGNFNFLDDISNQNFYYDKNNVYEKYLNAFKEVGGSDAYGQQEGNIFDSASFLSGVERAQGIGPENANNPEMFREFTPGMFKDLRTEAYQPQIEEGRSSLIDDLMSGRANISSMGRGIAGSGRRQRAEQDLSQQYTQGVENIYSNVQQDKASALQNILDVAGQYQDLRA